MRDVQEEIYFRLIELFLFLMLERFELTLHLMLIAIDQEFAQ